MFWIILILSLALAFMAFWVCGGREFLGDQLNKLFPNSPFQKGDKVHISLNGKYNRTATISGVSADRLFLYDNKVSLPVDYRGKFYAVGVDSNDGSKLVYVSNNKHFRFVRVAELIRKVFNVLDNSENLIVSEDSQAAAEVVEDSEEETGDEV